MSIKTLVRVSVILLSPACGGTAPELSSDAGDSAPAHGEAANLIATVTLDDGVTIEFYEPAAGVVWLSQTGAGRQRPVNTMPDRGRPESVVQFYQRVAPGREVPSALLGLQGRVTERLRVAPTGALPTISAPPVQAVGGGSSQHPGMPSGDAVAVTSETLTAAEFEAGSTPDGYAFCPHWPDSFNWCLTNWWGGAWARSGATDTVSTTVYADIGSVKLEISATNGQGGVWSVPEGTWRSWASLHETCFLNLCDFRTRISVSEAEGNRFHFGGQFYHWD